MYSVVVLYLILLQCMQCLQRSYFVKPRSSHLTSYNQQRKNTMQSGCKYPAISTKMDNLAFEDVFQNISNPLWSWEISVAALTSSRIAFIRTTRCLPHPSQLHPVLRSTWRPTHLPSSTTSHPTRSRTWTPSEPRTKEDLSVQYLPVPVASDASDSLYRCLYPSSQNHGSEKMGPSNSSSLSKYSHFPLPWFWGKE